jgi:hypothetical protein
MKYIHNCSCFLVAAHLLEAQSVPTLSISLLTPAPLQVSWPINFTSWQLASAANPAPAVD